MPLFVGRNCPLCCMYHSLFSEPQVTKTLFSKHIFPFFLTRKHYSHIKGPNRMASGRNFSAGSGRLVSRPHPRNPTLRIPGEEGHVAERQGNHSPCRPVHSSRLSLRPLPCSNRSTGSLRATSWVLRFFPAFSLKKSIFFWRKEKTPCPIF